MAESRAPDPPDLLRQTAWMHALARRLVRDEHQAQDLVQETLVQAIERPPRDAVALPRWLATVLRRKAWEHGRREGARRRRERRVGALRTQEPTAEAVARAEMHRRVVEALLALEEPFRTTLLLRFVEDMEPGRIAERLGLPVSTVRTRTKRGLDRLRLRLDAQHGDRRAWVLALLPLLERTEGGPGGGPSGAVVTGGTLVGTKVKGTALALLLLLAASGTVWWLWRGVPRGEETVPTPAEIATRRGAPALPGRPAAAPDTEPTPAEGAETPTAPPARTIGLRFVDEGGAPIAPAEVLRRYEEAGLAARARWVAPGDFDPSIKARLEALWGAPRDARAAHPFQAHAEGLRIEAPPAAGRWRLFLDRPGSGPLLSEVVLVDRASTDWDVPFPLSPRAVRVRLMAAEDDRPLAGARVVAFFEFGDDRAFFEGSPRRADEAGEVLLPLRAGDLGPDRGRGATWWIETPTHLGMLESWDLDAVAPGSVHEVRVSRSGAVEGEAWLPGGEPAAGREVVWARKGRTARATVADDGAFRLSPLPAGRPADLLLVLGPMDVVRTSVLVPAGETARATLGSPGRGDPVAVLEGRITAGGHRPWPEALLFVSPSGGMKRDRGRIGAADPAGRFRIEGVGPGPVDVAVLLGMVDDFVIRSVAPLDVAPGDVHRLDFDLPAGVLRVEVVDETGAPLAGAMAYAAPEDRTVESGRFEGFAYRAGGAAAADEAGVVLLRGLVPGAPHRMEVRAPGHASHAQEGVAPGTEEAPARVVVRLAPGR